MGRDRKQFPNKYSKPNRKTHGTKCGLFAVGQRVPYPESFAAGIVKRSPSRSVGTVLKLHRCGRAGTADIRAATGGRKIRRRLELVEAT